MLRQIYIGLLTEGTTDERFLLPITEKTFLDVAHDCNGEIDIEINVISITKTGLGFTDQVLQASKLGLEQFGIMILCLHADADERTLKETYQNKINPAISAVHKESEELYCKIIVALIPIQETESWMLADKELLKREIGTKKSDHELGIHRPPESIAKPKEAIENAIRIGRSAMTRRRRHELTIADLYFPIAQAISIKELEMLDSFNDFKENIKKAFRELNLLQE